MCYLVRVEDEKGIFKLFFRAEGIQSAYQLYKQLLNLPINKGYHIKLLDKKLHIIESNVAINSNREASL
jgi:hypothetical protein